MQPLNSSGNLIFTSPLLLASGDRVSLIGFTARWKLVQLSAQVTPNAETKHGNAFLTPPETKSLEISRTGSVEASPRGVYKPHMSLLQDPYRTPTSNSTLTSTSNNKVLVRANRKY